MEFMLLFTAAKGAAAPDSGTLAEMQRFADDLRRQGKMRRGVRLRPEAAATHVRVRDGQALVSDGPFAESKEVVGGFCIVEVASREEAVALARRCPLARHGAVEAHPMRLRYSYDDPGAGTPFLLAFRMEEGLCDPDGAKMREMIAFGEELARQGTLVETAPLGSEPAPARVVTRGGKTLVTDGPFAEVKEAVGGYSLVRVAGHREAVELATRYPHASWGPVEVREVTSVSSGAP